MGTDLAATPPAAAGALPWAAARMRAAPVQRLRWSPLRRPSAGGGKADPFRVCRRRL